MSTATVIPAPGPGVPSHVLLTAADVARLPTSLATTDVDYELHDGRLVIMSPPGYRHARVGSRFAAMLYLHGELAGHGVACDEVGVLLRRNPDHLLGPDAAFLTSASLPPRLSPEGYLLTVPELLVEVRSKSNTQPEVDEKVRDYLAAGAVLVWVADPEARTLTVYRSGSAEQVVRDADTLTCPLIPGFAVPVANLFSGS
ncbi:MAG: Uma2 family endonuclease [Gemmataceae bacterium]|nr:Uma2 family endonuclease [Gemmataceae bacterium]